MVSTTEENNGFGIEIDYTQDSLQNPARIFYSAGKMIDACAYFQVELSKGIVAITLEPYLFVENITYGSLLIWLRNRLESLKVQSLFNLNEKAYFDYLTYGTNELITLGNKQDITLDEMRKSQENILRIATSLNPTPEFPTYEIPTQGVILNSLKKISESTLDLQSGDAANLVLPSGERTSFNVSKSFSMEAIEDALTHEKTENTTLEILRIKEADFLGNSKWKMYLDKMIDVKIEDKEWLFLFKQGKVSLRSGDTMEAWVKCIRKYDSEMSLLSQSYAIERVVRIIGRGESF